MDIQSVSNIAEIFSAIMIIVSLLFVGFQIRDANRSTRAVTFQSIQDTETRFITFAMAHVDIWDRILNHEPFDPDKRLEIRQAILLISFFMIHSENRFRQYLEGNLAESSWNDRAAQLDNIFKCPLYRLWRQSPGASARAADFLASLDELYAEMISKQEAADGDMNLRPNKSSAANVSSS